MGFKKIPPQQSVFLNNHSEQRSYPSATSVKYFNASS